MLRFLFNFVLFGIMFYLISLYLPDAFDALVIGADRAVLFLQDAYQHARDVFSGGIGTQ
jgi:hypothetical protein